MRHCNRYHRNTKDHEGEYYKWSYASELDNLEKDNFPINMQPTKTESWRNRKIQINKEQDDSISNQKKYMTR